MNNFESIAENLIDQDNFTEITLRSGEEQEESLLIVRGQRVRFMANSGSITV